MSVTYSFLAPPSKETSDSQSPTDDSLLSTGIDVVRDGSSRRFLEIQPTLSSASGQWGGITLEDYDVPAVCIPRHEHPEHFLHLVISGNVEYEVTTKGRTLKFTSRPGTAFLLPQGTVDEVNWRGPTHRLAVAIHPRLITNALGKAADVADIEFAEHWNLADPHISALLLEMKAYLDEGSPIGTMYGESLTTALAVYLVKRYGVQSRTLSNYKGGLPRLRLKRVLDYIADNLAEDLSLSQLAAVAGMSSHYFSEMFKQSTGSTPHIYVLSRRIERAKEHLRNSKLSIIDVGLEAGFPNPSHFSRVFRKLVGTSPSSFQRDSWPR